MIHFERRLGSSWSTDQKPVGFVAFHLTLHPFRVQMRVSASAMLIPGHYLKRLKPISQPYGDVLLANYRACARGHVLEHQRVANDGQKSLERQFVFRKIEYSPTEPKAGVGTDLRLATNRCVNADKSVNKTVVETLNDIVEQI